jgi:hypothetical protein
MVQSIRLTPQKGAVIDRHTKKIPAEFSCAALKRGKFDVMSWGGTPIPDAIMNAPCDTFLSSHSPLALLALFNALALLPYYVLILIEYEI